MGQRLLAVDDDEASCRLLAAIFQPAGFEVLFAHDGRTGLALATTAQPDAVLLDLRLPELGGLEVLAHLAHTHPDLPVIVLTAHGEVKSAVRATQLGAVDYLTKPIDPWVLRAKVSVFVELWQKNRELAGHQAVIREYEQRKAATAKTVDAALSALRGADGVRDVGRAIEILEQARLE